MSSENISKNKTPFDPDSPLVKKDLNDINSWKVRLYLLQNLPTAFWWGLKVKSCSPYRTVIEIPFNWRTQNPFKSIYFAALAGAGELSTGLMAGLVIRGAQKMSMLVTNVEIDFIKKANTVTTFTCDEGIRIIEAVQKAIDTKQGVEVTLQSDGKNKGGELVCRFRIRWSFRVKN